jgi:type IV pilus assembly protein PilB
MVQRKGDFTDILLQRGIISRDQLTEARQMARETDAKISDSLLRLGYATGEEVTRALADH